MYASISISYVEIPSNHLINFAVFPRLTFSQSCIYSFQVLKNVLYYSNHAIGNFVYYVLEQPYTLSDPALSFERHVISFI
jgi:hypothetical protein